MRFLAWAAVFLAVASIVSVAFGQPASQPTSPGGEAGDLLMQIVAAFQGGKWLVAASGIITFLIWLFELIGDRIKPGWLPPWLKPWIAAVLGMAAAVLSALVAGESLAGALVGGLVAGSAAAGFWSLVAKYILQPKLVKDAKRAARAKLQADKREGRL